ncbi:MAG: hypothetical protein JNL62_11380 [Bryobacterales bacterium]|nr:hypothetical protein [Bryobacterales bacterium]
MSNRLLKRHKRQVDRARQNKKVSEPDLRTPEQIKAAREASRAVPGHAALGAHPAFPVHRGGRRTAITAGTKTDA